MHVGTFLLGFVYLSASVILFAAGKYFYHLTHRSFSLKEELVERDNLALAIAMGGYFVGLAFAVGGALSGEPTTLASDLTSILAYGALAILLLNLSVRINGWAILRRFSIEKEIIRDRNCGVGMVEAANHIAMGLIINGITSGEGGGIAATVVFWILGQLALIAAALLYQRITPYDVYEALENDNAAVGAAFAGMLIAIGNIVRFSVQGNFISWFQSLAGFATVVLFGLAALPLTRLATDRLILPGHRLTKELVGQENPNVGAGVIEASVYVAMSMLIGWCIQ